MWCTLIVHVDGSPTHRLGPFKVDSAIAAKELAHAQFHLRPDVSAIDVWEQGGELYRVAERRTPPER